MYDVTLPAEHAGKVCFVVAGYRFGRLGVGRIWFQRADGPREGEGTEISEASLRAALDKLFAETM